MTGTTAGETSAHATRVLPLHLCELLEEEYVALHGPLPPGYPDWTVTADQITAPATILAAWRKAAATPPESRDEPATIFDGHVVHRLEAAKRDTSPFPGDPIHDDLRPRLNALLDDPHLYLGPADRLPLRPETVEMATCYFDGTRMRLAGDDLRRFNRLLLEDAYPRALRPIYQVRLDAIMAVRHAKPSAALCFSGGGIRSGTFSLGVLQELARLGVLDQFHYLSTVSGGGYIGSWLTAWSHRHPNRLAGVVDELRKTAGRPKLDPEPYPLQQLREFSSFVAPRASLVSADIWSFVAIYLRNLLINWMALVPMLIGVLLLPRIAVAALYAPAASPIMWGLLGVGLLASVFAVFYTTINRPSRADALMSSASWYRRRDQPSFLRYSLTPTLVAAICLSTFWAWYSPAQPPSSWMLVILVSLGIIAYAAAIFAGAVMLRQWPQVADLVATLFTGGGGGFIAWLVLRTLFTSPAPSRETLPLSAALYGTLAVPAYLMTFFGAATVFVAATSRRRAAEWRHRWFAIEDEDREWLGRHGGWLLTSALGWAVGSALVVFGPIALLHSPKLLSAVGGVSGLVALLGGKSALSPATDERRPAPGWKMLLLEHSLSIAATLFIMITVAGVAWLSGAAIAKLVAAWCPSVPPPEILAGRPFGGKDPIVGGAWHGGQLAILYYAPFWLLVALAAGAFVACLIAAHVVNLNKFSLHAAYRARIIRAFLGASRLARERRANPFTGFDPQDNVQMHELRPGLLSEASFKAGGLTRLVVKLRDAHLSKDRASQQIHQRLSSATRKALARHVNHNPPSQSLKRNLLEDLNRMLDAPPGLHSLPALEGAPVADGTVALIRLLLAEGESSTPNTTPPSNAALARRLSDGRRDDAMLPLNRSILDSLYPGDLEPLVGPPPPYKLFHVVGTALNLVGGKRLAWQQRRAESFTISPLHCGSPYLGYRRSQGYGGVDGISLGTAVTISGAAVNSNMGYHSSSAAVTFVLTLFNARLGWWLGNPGHAGSEMVSQMVGRRKTLSSATYRQAYPASSLQPLRLEAFGLTDDTSPYVLLSDGGHFDNLGVYEMVLRRCRLIVVIDGSQDEKYAFDDLGAALRKIRIDLGIDIQFKKPIAIYPKDHPNAKNGKYCAVATIPYSVDGKPLSGPPPRDGALVYIKPALCGNEPPDVLQYASANPEFPHQSTADQFFDESQFESYRMLGTHVIRAICEGPPVATLSDFVRAADRHVGGGVLDDIDQLVQDLAAPNLGDA